MVVMRVRGEKARQQEQAYAELMGRNAAERQAAAHQQARACTCPKVPRADGEGMKMPSIHYPGCPRSKKRIT